MFDEIGWDLMRSDEIGQVLIAREQLASCEHGVNPRMSRGKRRGKSGVNPVEISGLTPWKIRR
jgi:hypothetical protein